MSQATIEIMSVLLIVWIAGLIIATAGTAYHWRQKLARYQKKALALNERERSIGKKIEDVTRKEYSLFIRECELGKRSAFKTTVFVKVEGEKSEDGRLPIGVRKKLASKLGYRILGEFEDKIRTAELQDGETDYCISIDVSS